MWGHFCLVQGNKRFPIKSKRGGSRHTHTGEESSRTYSHPLTLHSEAEQSACPKSPAPHFSGNLPFLPHPQSSAAAEEAAHWEWHCDHRLPGAWSAPLHAKGVPLTLSACVHCGEGTWILHRAHYLQVRGRWQRGETWPNSPWPSNCNTSFGLVPLDGLDSERYWRQLVFFGCKCFSPCANIIIYIYKLFTLWK